MVIDTSAVMSVLLNEPDGDMLLQRIVDDPVRLMSAGTLLELSIVADHHPNARLADALDALLRQLSVQIESVTTAHAELARLAYRRFGKGNHPAGLSFGDCFAYALAAASGEPLLCKGDDFARTDIARC